MNNGIENHQKINVNVIIDIIILYYIYIDMFLLIDSYFILILNQMNILFLIQFLL
jgi:hypothetical protein